jgi:hypothetical protein
MKNTTHLIRLSAVAYAAAFMGASSFVTSARGQAIGFEDFSCLPGDTNLGTSLSLFGGAVTVTARTLVDGSDPYSLLAVGQVGSIFNTVSSNPFEGGLGVQTLDGQGSGGISGAGSFQNEELILTYNNGGALAGSVNLFLNSLDFGCNEQTNGFASLDGDDPVMWITYDFGAVLAVDEFSLYRAAIPLGQLTTGIAFGLTGQTLSADNAYQINFGLISGLDPEAKVTSITLRETRDGFFLKAFDAGVVPEPSSAALILSAYGLLMIFRWRSRR